MQMQGRRTFRKEAAEAVGEMPTEEPAVTEFVIPLDELDPIALGQCELVGTASKEVMDHKQDCARLSIVCAALHRHCLLEVSATKAQNGVCGIRSR